MLKAFTVWIDTAKICVFLSVACCQSIYEGDPLKPFSKFYNGAGKDKSVFVPGEWVLSHL